MVEKHEQPDQKKNKPTSGQQPPPFPPAGPHAKEHLLDKDKTPGAGTLPSTRNKGEVDPGAG